MLNVSFILIHAINSFNLSLLSYLIKANEFSGALISISLFSHRLKWDDSVLGLISNFSKVVGAITTGLAKTTTQVYIGKY